MNIGQTKKNSVEFFIFYALIMYENHLCFVLFFFCLSLKCDKNEMFMNDMIFLRFF